VRGINRRKIFFDDSDRDDFLNRLGGILSDSKIACFAGAFMTNHLHLLLRTGVAPIASVMRRLLTGYAVSFNRRHRRHGHLFQNRYKSILCQVADPPLEERSVFIGTGALYSFKSLAGRDRGGIKDVGYIPLLRALLTHGESRVWFSGCRLHTDSF